MESLEYEEIKIENGSYYIYVPSEKYIYTRNRSTYFKCRDRKCSARLQFKNGLCHRSNTTPHNHEIDEHYYFQLKNKQTAELILKNNLLKNQSVANILHENNIKAPTHLNRSLRRTRNKLKSLENSESKPSISVSIAFKKSSNKESIILTNSALQTEPSTNILINNNLNQTTNTKKY